MYTMDHNSYSEITPEIFRLANMSKEGKNISMDTLVRICEALDCGILDVIELASDGPSATAGGEENGKTKGKNNGKRD